MRQAKDGKRMGISYSFDYPLVNNIKKLIISIQIFKGALFNFTPREQLIPANTKFIASLSLIASLAFFNNK